MTSRYFLFVPAATSFDARGSLERSRMTHCREQR
jgi:hypothetical protein